MDTKDRLTKPRGQKMTQDDDPIQVQIGFRTRPLRDGGGKPSLGRCSLHGRGNSEFASLEQDLCPFLDDRAPVVMKSLDDPGKIHPYQTGSSTRGHGPNFKISANWSRRIGARGAGIAGFPRPLRQGQLPLGKGFYSGEPLRTRNAWNLVSGPHTIQEAAGLAHRNFVQDLWQPLMKVTRFAPSMMAPGGANSHIQNHIAERTAAARSYTVCNRSNGCNPGGPRGTFVCGGDQKWC